MEILKLVSHVKRQCGAEKLLTIPSISLPNDYVMFVQTPLAPQQLEVARHSVNKGPCTEKGEWKEKMIDRFHLQGTKKGKGRPKKCS